MRSEVMVPATRQAVIKATASPTVRTRSAARARAVAAERSVPTGTLRPLAVHASAYRGHGTWWVTPLDHGPPHRPRRHIRETCDIGKGKGAGGTSRCSMRSLGADGNEGIGLCNPRNTAGTRARRGLKKRVILAQADAEDRTPGGDCVVNSPSRRSGMKPKHAGGEAARLTRRCRTISRISVARL